MSYSYKTGEIVFVANTKIHFFEVLDKKNNYIICKHLCSWHFKLNLVPEINNKYIIHQDCLLQCSPSDTHQIKLFLAGNKCK